MSEDSASLDREQVLLVANFHRNALIGYAFGILRDWAAAEDTVQEAFIVVHEKWEDYRSDEAIFPWVRGIVRFKCFEKLRKRQKEVLLEEQAIFDALNQYLDSEWNEPVQDLLTKRVAAMRNCLGKLTLKAQKLLYDYYVKGKSCHELARQENKKNDTPKTQLYRLRNRLRKCIHEQLENDGSTPDPSLEDCFDDLFADDATSSEALSQLKALNCSQLFIEYLLDRCALNIALLQFHSSQEGNATLVNFELVDKQPQQIAVSRPLRVVLAVIGIAATVLIGFFLLSTESSIEEESQPLLTEARPEPETSTTSEPTINIEDEAIETKEEPRPQQESEPQVIVEVAENEVREKSKPLSSTIQAIATFNSISGPIHFVDASGKQHVPSAGDPLFAEQSIFVGKEGRATMSNESLQAAWIIHEATHLELAPTPDKLLNLVSGKIDVKIENEDSTRQIKVSAADVALQTHNARFGLTIDSEQVNVEVYHGTVEAVSGSRSRTLSKGEKIRVLLKKKKTSPPTKVEDSSQTTPLKDNPQSSLAFPGAEGGGAYSVGGRKGRVIEVTNLRDKGKGSFRSACLEQGPRTIVFRVGGVIQIEDPIRIANPYITIAGQTAPGDGIVLETISKGHDGLIRIATHDIIIRYLRFRGGSEDIASTANDRGLRVRNNAKNIIVDHCSFSGFNDGNLSVINHADRSGKNISHLTFSNNIFAEASRRTYPEWAPRNFRTVIGDNPKGMTDISFIQNLFINNEDYTLSAGSAEIQIYNNAFYNWDTFVIELLGNIQGEIVANIFKPGPSSESVPFISWVLNDIMMPNRESAAAGNPELYIAGNINLSEQLLGEDAWTVWAFDAAPKMLYKSYGKTNYWKPLETDYQRNKPFLNTEAPITSKDKASIIQSLIQEDGIGASRRLDEMGKWVPIRDARDKRLINDFLDSEESYSTKHEIRVARTKSSYKDDDHDGMADLWEKYYGYDPTSAEDRNLDVDGDGYTTLEEFLNGEDPGIVK